jgi:hypothetical protein
MKITLISLAALAALTVAPIASQASDKESVKPKYVQASQRKHQQVALYVSGRGVGNEQGKPRTQTVQVGQGESITFFTGNR